MEKAKSATKLRLTRRGTIGLCQCKVGACRKCGAACKRCKCRCPGYSVLETVEQMRLRNEKDNKIKKKSKAKRKTQDTKLIAEPATRSSKRSKVARDWSYINDDDSTFLPSIYKINVTKNKESDRADKCMIIQPKFVESKNLTTAMTELRNIIPSLSIPKSKASWIKLISDGFETNIFKYSESSSEMLTKIMERLHLPTDASELLQSLLLLVLDKCNKVETYNTRSSSKRSRGKQLTTVVSKIRKKVIELSTISQTYKKKMEKSKTVDKNYDSDTITDPRSIDEEKNTNLLTTEVENIPLLDNGENTNDQLTDQVLTLPREYRPINLRGDQVLQKQHKSNKGNSTICSTSTATSTTFVHPTLPDIPDNIITRINTKLDFSSMKNTTKIHYLIDLLEQPKYTKTDLPSMKLRQSSINLEEDNKAKYKQLVHLGYKMYKKLLSILCSGPSQFKLQSDILQLFEREHRLTLNESIRCSQKNYELLSTALCLCTKSSQKRSIERRICRAILYKGTTKSELENLLEKHGFTFATGRLRKAAKSDFETLKAGHKLSTRTQGHCRVSLVVLEKAVSFILSEHNVVARSYGTITVKLSQREIIEIPCLMRKKTRSDIYRDYVNLTENDESCISRTTLFELMNHLTQDDQSMLSAIDYVSSILVNEPCETLQDIIDRLFAPLHQRQMSKLVQSAKHFLKHKYKSHVMQTDDICYHGLNYALGRQCSNRTNHHCNSCKYPFYACWKLQEMIDLSTLAEITPDEKVDAKIVVEDISEKFALYMAHAARCCNQSLGIKHTEKAIHDACTSTKGKLTRAILIIDFKMKFEAKSTRESTVEHFGKRGIGWHGCALIYYLYEQKKDDKGELMYNDNGESIMAPKKYIVYIDQVLEDGNRQDGLIVISLIESALVGIHDQLPFINEIIIQSDNANQYQNPLLILSLHLINMKMKNKIFISEYIHSETQDGKTILDAHFATTNRHILRFMKIWRENRITRVQTPAGLAFALSFNSGIRNTMIQLIEPNRNILSNLETKMEKIIKAMKKYYTRVNHIYYKQPASNDECGPAGIMNSFSTLSFKIGLQSFTNIDEPIIFEVNIEENTFEAVDSTIEALHTTNDESDDDGFQNQNSDTTYQQLTHQDKSDFSIHRKADFTSNFRSRHVASLENNVMAHRNESEDRYNVSSDEEYESDEEYNPDEDYSDEDDNLEDQTNVHNVNLREYGPPRSNVYNANRMITGVNIVKQQELSNITTKEWMSKKAKSKHNKTYEVQIERQDAVAKGVRFGKTLISSSDYFLDSQDYDPIHGDAEDYIPSYDQIFKASWAKRHSHGKLYGKKYITKYKDDLLAMFEEGKKNSSQKMNPGKMRERLLQKYPNHFSIPGETEIKQFIGSQIQKGKYQKKTTNNNETRGRKAGPKAEWIKLLEPFVTTRLTVKNAILFDEFITSLGDNTSWPKDLPCDDENMPLKKKITSSIANIKQRLKKAEKKTLLS